MATQPNLIVSGLQTPQAISPFQLAQGALTLGNLRQQQAIGAQNLEGLTQENQIRARQMAGQAAIQDAIKQLYGGEGATPGATGPQATAPAPIATQAPPQGASAAGSVPLGSVASVPPTATATPNPINPQGAAPMPGLPQFGTGIDYAKVTAKLLQGGFYQEAQSISKANLDWQKEALATQKEQADVAGKKIQQLGSLAGSVNDPQSFDTAVAQAMRGGLIDPAIGNKLLATGYTTENIKLLDQFKAQAVTAQEQITNHQKDLDYNLSIAKFQHEVAEKAPKTNQEWLQTGAMLFTPGMDAGHFQSGIQTLAKMGAPQEVQDAFSNAGAAGAAQLGMTGKERADANNSEVELAKTATDPNRTPEERAAASAALNRLDASKRASRPVSVTNVNSDQSKADIETAAQSLVKAANGAGSDDLSGLKDIASMRGGQRLRIFARAREIAAANGQTFNTSIIDRKIKMQDDADNGKMSLRLQSFGTFLEHGGAAMDVTNNIWQSQSKLANKPINWWRDKMSGDPNYTALMVALEPVRKEFEKFLLGGQALYTDDRKAAETILSNDSSPAQIQSALKQMGHTAQARFTEENGRYKKLMGRDLQDPFTPEAVEGARKIGVKLGTASQQANPQAQPTSSAASGPPDVKPGFVRGQLPDGSLRDFPQANWAEAQKRGAKPTGGAAQPAAAPAAQPKAKYNVGDTKNYQGRTYKFDGNQWVGQ